MREAMLIRKYISEWPWGMSVTLIHEDGCGMIEFTKRKDASYAYISNLKVHPSVQKQGRGTELIRMAENEISAIGLKFALLQVLPGSWMEEWDRRLGYSTGQNTDDGFVELIKML